MHGPWLLAALSGSVLLPLAAPAVGQLTGWLRDIAREHYATVLGAVVLTAAGVAAMAALVAIRDRRRFRYGVLLAAVALAVAYGGWSRSGVAEVDAAERFHFVEYGLLALLFYKAARSIGDATLVVLPILAGVLVGMVEEWVQWFVPGRVGEARDVLLNLVAVVCGVLVGIALDPPTRWRLALDRSSRPLVAALMAAVVLAFALFIHSVHLGVEIVDPEAGTFRSRYDASELQALADERRRRWQTAPPLELRRFSREDQYFSEAIARIRRRNERWSEKQVLAARQENLILEKYFGPVLDTPSYVARTGHRWAPEQHLEAEAATASLPGASTYVSDALPYPVYAWPRWAFWTCALGVAAGLWRAIAR